MIELEKKIEILKNAGFHYNFNRDIYFNRSRLCIISVEAITDHSLDWLKKQVLEINRTSEWMFVFNSAPSDNVKEEIIRDLS